MRDFFNSGASLIGGPTPLGWGSSQRWDDIRGSCRGEDKISCVIAPGFGRSGPIASAFHLLVVIAPGRFCYRKFCNRSPVLSLNPQCGAEGNWPDQSFLPPFIVCHWKPSLFWVMWKKSVGIFTALFPFFAAGFAGAGFFGLPIGRSCKVPTSTGSVKALQSTPRAKASLAAFDNEGSLCPCSHFTNPANEKPVLSASCSLVKPAASLNLRRRSPKGSFIKVSQLG